MARKPKFVPPVADHLSERAKALWEKLVPSRAASLERCTFLQTALEALDRADEARRAIAVAGMTSTTASTGAIHLHPLVKLEREARQQFARIWCDLGFNSDPDSEWPV